METVITNTFWNSGYKLERLKTGKGFVISLILFVVSQEDLSFSSSLPVSLSVCLPACPSLSLSLKNAQDHRVSYERKTREQKVQYSRRNKPYSWERTNSVSSKMYNSGRPQTNNPKLNQTAVRDSNRETIQKLIFMEGGKPWNPKKSPQSAGENQQATLLSYTTKSGNLTQAALTRGLHSYHHNCWFIYEPFYPFFLTS